VTTEDLLLVLTYMELRRQHKNVYTPAEIMAMAKLEVKGLKLKEVARVSKSN
jgi:hypothetical protein